MEPASMFKVIVSPTLPVLPLCPLTVEEQAAPAQPSAFTAVGISTMASIKIRTI